MFFFVKITVISSLVLEVIGLYKDGYFTLKIKVILINKTRRVFNKFMFLPKKTKKTFFLIC